jgi:hypothetical protein
MEVWAHVYLLRLFYPLSGKLSGRPVVVEVKPMKYKYGKYRTKLFVLKMQGPKVIFVLKKNLFTINYFTRND